MPAITASMVAELRAKTDAPMMECKKALTEADGDAARAEEILRVKLGSKASAAAMRGYRGRNGRMTRELRRRGEEGRPAESVSPRRHERN